MSPAPLPAYRLPRKTLLRIAIALALLYAAYLAAANVFLGTALGERAFNRHPQRFHIHWTRAWSLYPGHVHATGLEVSGHTGRNRWRATSPQASGRIRLLPLLLRRLSFGPIDARAVEVVLERDAPFLAPRTSASRLPPWRLHFDAIRSDSPRALRLAEWTFDRFRGAHASFALDKTLGGAVEILPSTLRARAARVAYREVVIAQDARVDYAMTMAPHSHRDAQGFERVRYVDARLTLDGRAPGLSIARGAGKPLTFATGQGSGRVRADLALRDGAFQPGGRVRWSAPLVVDAAHADTRLDRLQVQADVRDDGVAIRAQVPRRAGRAAFVEARLHLAERRLHKTTVRQLLRATSGTIALRWHFETLRWLGPLISEGGWLRLEGEADIDADLRLQQGRLATGSRASMPRAQVQADIFDTVLSGDARVDAKVDGERTTVDIVAQRFQLAPQDAPGAPYVEGRNVGLELLAHGDLSEFRRTLQARLKFGDARIPDLSAYNRNLPGDSLRLLGGSGTLGADLALDARGRVARAALQLRGRDADVRLGSSRLLGDLRLDTRLRQADGDPRRYAIDALALDLDRVRTGDADAPPWWARIAVDNGRMTWRSPFQVQGDVRLRLKDASVLLDLYSERSAFPRWIGNIVDAGQVQATARVRAQGDTLVLDRIRARNDRVALLAHLRIAAGEPDGALLAQWGILDVGAEVRNGQRKLHLKGAERWYRALPQAQAP